MNTTTVTMTCRLSQEDNEKAQAIMTYYSECMNMRVTKSSMMLKLIRDEYCRIKAQEEMKSRVMEVRV